MSRAKINGFLIVVIVAIFSMIMMFQRDFSQPNYVFMPEMVHSEPYDSYAPNPNFADGKTWQLPVAGTIARDNLPMYFDASESDAIRAGRELTSPWSGVGIDDDELFAARNRGRHVYAAFCLPCHGALGNGDGPVTKNGFPPPPSLGLENSLNMSDGQMFHVVTFGQKNMPGYAPQISTDDRWKAILHLRALQEKPKRDLELARITAASIGTGKQLFEKLNCIKCHTVSADEKPLGPYLGKVAATKTREMLLESIRHPSKSIEGGYETQRCLMFDGKTHTGFVTAETAETLTLRNTDGNEIVLAIEEIDVRRTLEISPMPEDLIKDLTEEELNSLLDFLQSLTDESTPAATPPKDQNDDDSATEKRNDPDVKLDDKK